MSDPIEQQIVATQLARIEGEILAKLERTRFDKVWDIITKIVVGLTLMLVAKVGATAWDHEMRLQSIESNRLTATQIQERMAEMDRRVIAAMSGPDWLRAEINSVSLKLDAIKESNGKLAERISRLEAGMQRK